MVLDGWLDIRREKAIFWDDLSQRSHMLADSLQDVLANPLYRDDIAWAKGVRRRLAPLQFDLLRRCAYWQAESLVGPRP